jgi:bifunctional DNA-binding transcriptional regulator/antitoxin component of YhaV-PrlF toxin-antitoxin module
MSKPQGLLSVKPVRVWGHGHVVSLPPEVREVLGAKFGDMIVFRKVGRYVFLSVLREAEGVPVSVDELEGARTVLEG